MTLLIARHGQTDWNLTRRWQSRTDIPLNAFGLQQAHALAECLQSRGFKPARIIASPLVRAKVTAEILASGFSLEVEADARLVELDLGDWEGVFEDELRRRDPDFYDKWRADCYRAAPPGGESILDVAARIRPLVEEVRESEGDILLVAHQGVNMALKGQLSGCFSVSCLESYRQSNDEIDLWEVNPAGSIGRLKAFDDGG